MRKIAFLFLVMFVFSLPWENSLTIGSLGTFNRLIGLAASGLWLISIFTHGHLREFHPFHFAVLLFILWNLVSMFWSISVEETQQRTNTYLQLALLSYMLWDQVMDAVQLRIILQAYVLGCFVSILGTISNFAAGIEAFEYSGGRYVATGFNANDLAIILAMGLPIAWYLLLNPLFEHKWRNMVLVNLIFIPSAFFAILLTGSRAGLLTTLVAVLYILLSDGNIKWWKKAVALCLVFIGFLFVQALVPEDTFERLSTTAASIISGDLGGRGVIYRDAIRIMNSTPILGVGSGAFSAASTLKTLAHNTIISILSETGVIGLILFSTIISIALVEAYKMPRMESRFWISILFLWALGSSSVSWEFRKPTWFLLTMLIATAEIMRNQRNQREERVIMEKTQSKWAVLEK